MQHDGSTGHGQHSPHTTRTTALQDVTEAGADGMLLSTTWYPKIKTSSVLPVPVESRARPVTPMQRGLHPVLSVHFN